LLGLAHQDGVTIKIGGVNTERRHHGDLPWVKVGHHLLHGHGRLQGRDRFHGRLQVLMVIPFIQGLGGRRLGGLQVLKVDLGAHPLRGACLAHLQETPCDHNLHWTGHLLDTSDRQNHLASCRELRRLLQEGAAADGGRGGARKKSPMAASVDVGGEKAGMRVMLKAMQERRVLAERGENIVTKMERVLANRLQKGTNTIHRHLHPQQDLRSPRATPIQQLRALR